MQKAGKKRCVRGCPGRIVDKARGIYCPHIEAKLPKISKDSVKATPKENIENYSGQFENNLRELPGCEVELKLKRFGLDDFEVELLMLRFVEARPMVEVVKEQGWINVNSANYYLKCTLDKLRRARFTFR